jgi:hypothetical protein
MTTVPALLYVIGFVMIIFGGIWLYRLYKKSRKVECTGCGKIMDKNEFEDHKKMEHKNTLNAHERMLMFKSFLKDKYQEAYANNMSVSEQDLEKWIIEGSKIVDIQVNTARRIVENLRNLKPNTREIICECCDLHGNRNDIKYCIECNHLFCRPCIFDHPCLEGKSNPDRATPFRDEVKK